MLESVKVYPIGATSKEDALEFEDVEFLSFINEGTFGKPAIVAPGPEHKAGEAYVLYVNTGAVLAVEVEK